MLIMLIPFAVPSCLQSDEIFGVCKCLGGMEENVFILLKFKTDKALDKKIRFGFERKKDVCAS